MLIFHLLYFTAIDVAVGELEQLFNRRTLSLDFFCTQYVDLYLIFIKYCTFRYFLNLFYLVRYFFLLILFRYQTYFIYNLNSIYNISHATNQ